ncbi:hypothetical protein BsIDN1_33780 [Bacillus safensis]|uniref:Flavodoxin-like fold domain-containing protein n=1 Tax=Bacillus safensis TaxID=561879 RepID=A0A5S9M871_BACIA|nr:hypothetical protein BsIDN1_33780 [Bacillus safensis]
MLKHKKIEAVNAFTKQFMEVDKYIIQSSMWNLGIQPLLKKAYFDTIMSAGKTFKYTAEGPEGLMKEKKKKSIFMEWEDFIRRQLEWNIPILT